MWLSWNLLLPRPRTFRGDSDDDATLVLKHPEPHVFANNGRAVTEPWSPDKVEIGSAGPLPHYLRMNSLPAGPEAA